MQKIAIIGFGSEGLSAYHFFRKQGADITIFDESEHTSKPVPPDAKFIHGKDCFNDLTAFDVVVRFPAISPRRIHTNGRVTSVIQEFLTACPAQIIGVTGSKGKGTTSSLIYGILQNAGTRAHLAGNIGIAALDILDDVAPDDIVVLELSSFQLWDVKKSPDVAVVLMVEQEHLDIHADMQDYLQAKSNIVRWQTVGDITVYLPTNELTKKVALVGEGQKIPYTQPPGAYVKDGHFMYGSTVICPVTDMKLQGVHNQQNACAAITAVWRYTQDVAAIAKTLREFKGLPHRLNCVRTVRDVTYYDDSFATTPTSAVAAIQAFAAPKVIILGGSDKGSDYTEVAKAAVLADMRGVVLIGHMRHKLKAAFDAAGYKGEVRYVDEHGTMQQIVATATGMAQPGDVVVLSPACASFDMFKNYKDRGEQFIAAVNELSA